MAALKLVGLMCLYVFCEGDEVLYRKLQPFARSLGAAFQKVNFSPAMSRRLYRPPPHVFSPVAISPIFLKARSGKLEADIQHDFEMAYKGILMLPVKSKFGVYVAYKYYLSLSIK